MAPGNDPSIDAESHSGTIIKIVTVFGILSTILALARFYTRIFILRSFGLDDATLVAAQACALVFLGLQYAQVALGMGRHIWTIPPETLLKETKVFYAAIVFYNLGMNIVKLSFLLFYRRIFPEDRVRRICIGLMVFVGLWTITQILTLCLSCIPISIIVPSMLGHCLDTMPIWYFSAAMSIVTDFIIFLVPLPSVATLKLPIKQKIAVFCMFGLGFFTCAISVIRIFTLKRAIETTDPTYDLSSAAYWSSIEINFSVICASLPTLRPLLVKLGTELPSAFSRDSHRRSTFDVALAQPSRPQKLSNQGGDETYYLGQNSSTEHLRNGPGHQPGGYSSGASLVISSTMDHKEQS